MFLFLFTDAMTVIGFLKHFGLDKDFKVDINSIVSYTHHIVIRLSNCHTLVKLSYAYQIVIHSSNCHTPIKLSYAHQIVIRSSNCHIRGRPWRYSVIPSSPDFPTEYQIRRNSNPAGLPVFAAIWGLDFKANIIILTNMFKQIKQITITMFKVYPSPANADL